MAYLCPLCMKETSEARCVQDGFETILLSEWKKRCADDPMIGRVLGEKYRLTERLGAGGMGVVFGGVNVALQQWVAVKLLLTQRFAHSPPLMNRLRGRFRREALLTSRLDHPNIIRTFDFGTDEDETFFLVMEWVRGVPLDRVLTESGPLSPERTVKILRQITAGLVEAHQHNVIHRDLKPHNILLLQKTGLSDFVKVLDFGVATMLDDDVEMTPLTRPDGVVGSPPFMSPEQASSGEIDQRTDLYAVGVIAYNLLTGRLPFEGRTPVEILMRHIQEPPPPFTATELARIPEPLAACIFRLLEKQPADRYPSAEVLFELFDAMGTETQESENPLKTPPAGLVNSTPTVDLPDTVPGTPNLPPSASSSRKRWLGWGGLGLLCLAGLGYWMVNGDRSAALPPAGVDRIITDSALVEDLELYTDGHGHYLAYPRDGGYKGPLFAGSNKRLYRQRRIGGTRSGGEFSHVFWDPRFKAGARRSLSLKGNDLTLRCGERTVLLRPVDEKTRRGLLAEAQFLEPRWQRRGVLLGTDEFGNYYYVDRAREKGGDGARLFVGPLGRVVYLPSTALIDDDQKLVVSTETGRLVYRKGESKAQWHTDDGVVDVDVQNLWLSSPLIYTVLGAYTDAVGTPCDPYPPTIETP